MSVGDAPATAPPNTRKARHDPNHTQTLKRGGLAAAASLFVAVAAAGGPASAATGGDTGANDPLTQLYGEVSQYSAADYTAASWASFSSTKDAAATLVQGSKDGTARAAVRAKLESAADGLVMVRGLKDLVADYQTRISTRYTTASWVPFTKALSTAAGVVADGSATAGQVAAAKTALQTAAGNLVAADAGTFQTITTDTFWKDTSGSPIYSQGGGVFKFGDTYYWYGVHYKGAEDYRANPTKKFDNEVTFVSIPVYSSEDLVNWKFERNVATTSTTLPGGGRLGGWVGRLGVVYNENPGPFTEPVAVQRHHRRVAGGAAEQLHPQPRVRRRPRHHHDPDGVDQHRRERDQRQPRRER